MKLHSLLFTTMLASVMAVAQAQICKVTDPTNTPLNVRNSPNGRVLGELRNQTTVTVIDYDTDDQGRSWAYIRWEGQPLKGTKTLRNEGWVFREFISCYR